MSQQTRGAIAAGHPQVVEAGLNIFRMGGNAFDSAVAAMLASCVAEPGLTSLAGGGFLLAHTKENQNMLFDFFSQTPRQKRPVSDVDFHAIDVDFGITTQQFHVGLGSVATPGTLAGIVHVHQRLGRLPFTEVIVPALELARNGAEVNDFQAYCCHILRAILLASDEMRQVLAPTGTLVTAGDRIVMPQWANSLEYLAQEGAQAFYGGDIGRQLIHDCHEQGGYLTREDLAHYHVIERSPLTITYRGHTLLTNPPPSSGGALIAFSLRLLEQMSLADITFGSQHHIQQLSSVMQVTNQARAQGYDQQLYQPDVLDRFLSDDAMHHYGQHLAHWGQSPSTPHSSPLNKWGSTTHISVVDAEGNAASVTASNGEGSSYVIPGTGIMMNNMLGEADLHPNGFHQWVKNQRISSMMAPTIMLKNGRPELVLGSGGSNRIRTAIVQVVSNLLDFQMPVEQAIRAPRMHWENGVFNLEPGFDAVERAASSESSVEDTHQSAFPFDGEVIAWEQPSMFFGGVHAVKKMPDGTLTGEGDRRRGGAFGVIE
ncbi:MAG: gamma-glutamyltransferase [Cyanobacteria bacterium J06627_8]